MSVCVLAFTLARTPAKLERIPTSAKSNGPSTYIITVSRFTIMGCVCGIVPAMTISDKHFTSHGTH